MITDLCAHLDGRLDQLSADTVALAEINSGSYNPDGVNACGERLSELADTLDPATNTTIAVGTTTVVTNTGQLTECRVGDALQVTKRPDAPFQICLFGHLDTVFGADDPFQRVSADGHRLHGPGVADCKGGLILALEVLRYLDRTDWGDQVGWELLVVPDEEIGSVGSKPLLAAAAKRNHLGLGFEPALPSGGIAAARKGSLNVHTIAHGVAAHAGRAHDQGRSAIRAVAQLVDQLETHNNKPGITVNCGRIAGGGALNVVPDLAIASYNIRVESAEDQKWIESAFTAAADESDLDIEVVWTSQRPPKLRTPQLNELIDDAAAAGELVNDPIVAEDTGGCCDGNDLAAAGLVNLDSLGIRGGDIHSANEFAHVNSIPTRAAIAAHIIQSALARHQT